MTRKTEADGWIRNRGRRTLPYPEGTLIEVRRRSGKRDIVKCGDASCSAGLLHWYWTGTNVQGLRDIVAYRKCEHDQTPAAPAAPVFNPIDARDRVLEIDALVGTLAAERAQLVGALLAEGFTLVERVTLAADVTGKDMDDWRNWRVGDLVTVVSEEEADACGRFIEGRQYRIVHMEPAEYEGPLPVKVSDEDRDGCWPSLAGIKWHSRRIV